MNAPADAAKRAELARLQALARAAGCTLHALEDGRFLVSRWSLSRELPDLQAVAALLRAMGATQ